MVLKRVGLMSLSEYTFNNNNNNNNNNKVLYEYLIQLYSKIQSKCKPNL